MPDKRTLQQRMFSELHEKRIFKQACSYGHDYIDAAFDRHVYPRDEALRALKAFEHDLPEEPGDASAIIDLLNRLGSPATVTHTGGRYFGFVTGGSIPVGMAAKALGTFWDQNTALHVLSPLCSRLESVVEGWLKELFHLPDTTVAGFVSGTSAANVSGLAAARYRLLHNQGWNVNERGLFNAPRLRIVIGRHAHTTVIKALALLGFGRSTFEWVDVDDQGRMIPECAPELDGNTILILQAGNVNSGSFDPFTAICRKANMGGAWVHIDGAFGLWAAAVQQLRGLTDGIEHADSWAVDGHKTLNTPYDNGVVLCKDQEALVSALHMSSGYILVSEDARDGMFYTPEMSRRARIIELWATLSYLGHQGISELVYGLHQRATQFAQELKAMAGFTVLNDVVFNQVLVQCETDELTARTIQNIQELRECWVGGSTWNGRTVIRISVSSWATTPDDIHRSAQSFKHALQLARGAETPSVRSLSR
jgi:glutamate/tyrosine decarboxylase-like PLP-dependent enzyme